MLSVHNQFGQAESVRGQRSLPPEIGAYPTPGVIPGCSRVLSVDSGEGKKAKRSGWSCKKKKRKRRLVAKGFRAQDVISNAAATK